MRVIAGRVKGRRLKGPPSRSHRGRAGGIRPSSDLTRGAIFSALASMNVDLSLVLDLYAGSGSLGIEALSRGAKWCDFVERDASLCAIIRENIRLTGFEQQTRVHCISAERALERLEGPYAVILADPPYADPSAISLMHSLAASALVDEGTTVLVLEHSARDDPLAELVPFSLMSTRRHGDSAVSIYR